MSAKINGHESTFKCISIAHAGAYFYTAQQRIIPSIGDERILPQA